MDILPGVYRISFRLDPELLTGGSFLAGLSFDLTRVEIRKGFMYGPVELHLQPFGAKR